jgi:hypothetical protein
MTPNQALKTYREGQGLSEISPTIIGSGFKWVSAWSSRPLSFVVENITVKSTSKNDVLVTAKAAISGF